jgi:8-oxo-dGTP pyrophosphatase MutT (NUDIX family)
MTTQYPIIWEVKNSEKGPDLILFQTRLDQVVNPRNTHRMTAIVLESPDWVNVVALTSDKKILVVEQHRFGIGETTVEVPAGIIDPGENSELAAKRELKEETGYISDTWKYLGTVEANPAFMNNYCHIWLALDAKKKLETEQDTGEHIESSAKTLDEIRIEIETGRMRNSLTLLALSRVFDLREMNLS